MLYFLGWIIFSFDRLKRKALSKYYLHHFKKHGKQIYISQGCSFTPKTISLGNNVYFGKNCIVHSGHGNIIIGNHVMFGPGVNIHGGNHIIDGLSCCDYMDQQKKTNGDDAPVVIDDDVWVGANAIILVGVRIGRGAVIGAGSVVTHNVEPYTVVAGVPAKKIRNRKMNLNR